MHRQFSSSNRVSLLRRLDRVAEELNVFLLVVVLGLATLDFTFFVTEMVVDNLPPVTHINYDQPDSPH